MIYLFSFGIFLLFVLGLALGMLMKRSGLKSESEANAILEGISCAACTMNCGFAGKKSHKPKKSCAGKVIPSRAV